MAKKGDIMKITKILALMIGLTVVTSQAYFWEDWGKQSTPAEKIEKEKIDLKYQEKVADVEYKKQRATRQGYEQAREKRAELEHKKSELELKRQKDRLKVERE